MQKKQMNPIEFLIDKINKEDLWQGKRVLKRGEVLKAKEKTDTNLYFVVSGSIRVFIIDAKEDQTIRFAYMGSFFVLLDSFIKEQPSVLQMQAIKKTELLILKKDRFTQLIESSEDNMNLWKKILEALIYQQFEREIDILTSSPLERYKRVLKRSPKLFQEVPHKYIASYLRMTPETLSRLKKS